MSPSRAREMGIRDAITQRLAGDGRGRDFWHGLHFGLGCTVGPRYKRPTAQVPDTWRGECPWQTAAPKDAIPKGAWWEIPHDAELDRLQQE